MRKIVVRFFDRLFPNLMTHLRQIRAMPKKVIPKDSPIGFKFSGHNQMESGNFEPHETKLFKQLLPDVDVVVNVGANVGYYCCLALAQNKSVVAFEPIPQNLHYLLHNIKANGWTSNIEVFPIALGNKAGVLEMYGGGTGASLVEGWAGTLSQYSSLVPCSTLDTVLGDRFQGKRCFMMVDIEGAEKIFLEGSSKMLENDAIWLVEIAISEHQPKGVKINPNLMATFREFWSRGYQAWTTNDGNRIVTQQELDSIASGKNAGDCLGGNYLFIHPDKHSDLDIWKSLQSRVQ